MQFLVVLEMDLGLQHGLLENMIVVRYLTASHFPEGVGYAVGGSNIVESGLSKQKYLGIDMSVRWGVNLSNWDIR